MTRSHKANDPVRDGSGTVPANGEMLPRNYGKHATHGEKTKKSGGGKANWGRDGDELIDTEEFRMHNARRRSNSKGHIENQFVKSKFEDRDDPVFLEEAFPPAVPAAVVEETDASTTASSTSTDKS